jgi:hypothetical protein
VDHSLGGALSEVQLSDSGKFVGCFENKESKLRERVRTGGIENSELDKEGILELFAGWRFRFIS